MADRIGLSVACVLAALCSDATLAQAASGLLERPAKPPPRTRSPTLHSRVKPKPGLVLPTGRHRNPDGPPSAPGRRKAWLQMPSPGRMGASAL